MATTDLSVTPESLTDILTAPAKQPAESQTISEVIRDVSNGHRKAADLDLRTRQECVMQLSLDGFSNDEIAALMGVTERTVTRDCSAARKAHALRPDCELGDELPLVVLRVSVPSCETGQTTKTRKFEPPRVSR